MDIDTYYACQMKVPRVGREGQATLAEAKCLVVGLGGLGCPVAIYLAGSGIGKLGICDYDRVDLSNISRQILYHPSDVGEKKIEIALKKLRSQNPYIQVVRHDEKINEANWQEIISSYDVVLDCTDNFPSKYLIHDACLVLKKDLIQAGIFQTSGQVYYLPFSKTVSCLRCIWPEIPALQQNCSEAGVMTVVAGTTAMQQVNITLLSLLGKYSKPSCMSVFDWEHLKWSVLDIPQLKNCMCQSQEQLKQKTAYLYQTALEIQALPEENIGEVVLLDVRDPEDQSDDTKFQNYTVQKLSAEDLLNFDHFIQRASKNKSYVLICYKGVRSLTLAKHMHKNGYTAFSYIGGYANL